MPIQLSVRIHVRSCCSSQSSCTFSHWWAEISVETPFGPSVSLDGDGGACYDAHIRIHRKREEEKSNPLDVFTESSGS